MLPLKLLRAAWGCKRGEVRCWAPWSHGHWLDSASSESDRRELSRAARCWGTEFYKRQGEECDSRRCSVSQRFTSTPHSAHTDIDIDIYASKGSEPFLPGQILIIGEAALSCSLKLCLTRTSIFQPYCNCVCASLSAPY
jgi:hypothetical protein